MRSSLCEFFSRLGVSDAEGVGLCQTASPTEALLDDFAPAKMPCIELYLNPKETAVIAGLYSKKGVDFSCLPNTAKRLFELSANAFDALVHAWMSELPLETKMLSFGGKIINAKNRAEAENAASNRADDSARIVLETAYRVWHEIDRFRGFMSFIPDANGRYIAHCEPDYFILPALGEHFSLRFGGTPWAIIDDKRGLCLNCFSSTQPDMQIASAQHAEKEAADKDQWERLWRNYHQIINNESRNNSELQCQFMPKRYWKNLPEMKSGH